MPTDTAQASVVLVTGASGFLGGRLVEMLAAEPQQDPFQQVRVLARPTADLSHLSHLPIQIARGDLADAATLAEAVRDVRVIYHCAACSTDWAPLSTYVAANVLGTRNLLTAARSAQQLERFVHVSTTDVYGYPERVGDEDSPLRDRGLPYNRTKLQGEQAVWQAHRDYGLPITIVRPATIYGPRGKAFVTDFEVLLRQRLMLLVDGGRARGGFTYVDNTAQAMMEVAVSPATLGRAYNISDGTNASWASYTQALADALGYPRPWLRLPFSIAMTAAAAMETPYRALPLTGRPLLTRHAVYLLGRDQEFPAERARQEFGFAPRISFEEGIARSVAWLRR